MIKEVSQDLIENMLLVAKTNSWRTSHVGFALAVDADYEMQEARWGYGSKKERIVLKPEKYKTVCFCDGGKVHENTSPKCPVCQANNQWGSLPIIYDSAFIKKVKAKKDEGHRIGLNYSDNQTMQTSVNLLQTYYVREHETDPTGIEICRLTMKGGTDKNGNPSVTAKYDKFVEIIPGKIAKAYKVTKKDGTTEIDMFDGLRIGAKSIFEPVDIYWEGAASMIDFLAKHPDFAKRTGLKELVKHYTPAATQYSNCVSIPENTLFMFYLYLYSEYPVVELLVKMGYNKLILDTIRTTGEGYTRASVRDNVKKLSDLLNQTTKGSLALSIPTYVGEFLKYKNANASEYMDWSNICERQPLSKENFEKFIDSEAYFYLNYHDCLGKLPDILKYGYTLEQATSYILKQFLAKEDYSTRSMRYGSSAFAGILTELEDYLRICELMNLAETDLYPQNIQAAHTRMVEAYRAVENKVNDQNLRKIADRYAGFTSESKYLDVVFPKCVQDFVNEGHAQHNCVGSYANSVLNGHCKVFFIRKKTDMEDSYITAECRKNGLGQLMYRNNTPVNDYTEREFAKAVCKYILSKPW